MKSYPKWLTAAMVLAVVACATAGLFESDDAREARSRAEALIRLCESGANQQELRVTCYGVWTHSGLLGAREQARLVAPLLSVLQDTAQYDDGTHFRVVALLGRLRRPEVVPSLLTCLPREGRPLTRFQAGVALTRLGHASAGLPVVEEWARRGQRASESLDTPGSPTMDFLYPPLTLSERKEDSVLNRYFVRVLSYPSQDHRMDAIRFLLLKDGTNKNAAFDAAIDILANPQPDRGARFIERDRGEVLTLLRKHGGVRGKVLAETYEKR